jgi:hypothetical protein
MHKLKAIVEVPVLLTVRTNVPSLLQHIFLSNAAAVSFYQNVSGNSSAVHLRKPRF